MLLSCIGNVVFANTSWQPSTRTAPVLIIATGSVACRGSNLMTVNDFVVSEHLLVSIQQETHKLLLQTLVVIKTTLFGSMVLLERQVLD